MLSKSSAQSHNNFFQTNYNFKMLITPERKVPQRSDASQKNHKSKGYPAKTSAAAFTMQSRIQAPISDFCIRLFIRLFKIRLNSPSSFTTGGSKRTRP